MNIFEISHELEELIFQIEENGGELTEELEEQLCITQENYKNKLEDYTKVIKSINFEIDAIDKELDRLKELKLRKNKIIDKLNNILIDNVERLGDEDKSGNKFIKYGTFELQVKHTNIVVPNENVINVISDDISNCIKDYNVFNYNDYNLTDKDVDNINVEVSTKIPLKDFQSIKLSDGVNKNNCKISVSISKNDAKKDLINHENMNSCHIEQNTILKIK